MRIDLICIINYDAAPFDFAYGVGIDGQPFPP